MYSKLEKFRYLKVLLPAVTGFFLLAFGVNAFGSPPEFVTICHAAGRAGTTKFVTLKLPVN
ncbi:hypothetical protein HYW39_01120, partial [Candidatus Curtissbacteria bacterium]|nr:hypothetical protein [Candidatus Curtissbacteria bacterium]